MFVIAVIPGAVGEGAASGDGLAASFSGVAATQGLQVPDPQTGTRVNSESIVVPDPLGHGNLTLMWAAGASSGISTSGDCCPLLTAAAAHWLLLTAALVHCASCLLPMLLWANVRNDPKAVTVFASFRPLIIIA